MEIHWDEILQFGMSPAEMAIRGTITYWFIFLLMRFAGRRDVGSLGIADLLVVVLIADAAQNSMAGDYKNVPDGLVLIATIVAWSLVIDRVSYYVPATRPFLHPPKLCIIKDGVPQRKAMRRESMTMDEVMSELRQHGIDDLASVRRAYIEQDGSVSVLRNANSQGTKT
jgi:uncharacterized membrane protein YcaP (DUF421 family)